MPKEDLEGCPFQVGDRVKALGPESLREPFLNKLGTITHLYSFDPTDKTICATLDFPNGLTGIYCGGWELAPAPLPAAIDRFPKRKIKLNR